MNLAHSDRVGPTIIAAPRAARNMSDDQLSPEQQLAAQQQFLKILPYILGFGWVAMIPLSYLFIAPVFVEGLVPQLLVTIGFIFVTGIIDITFYKIFANTVEEQSKHLEQQSNEANEEEPIKFGTIL